MTDQEDQNPEIEETALPADPSAWSGAEPKQSAFLTALVISAGHRGKAAKAAKISRATHYRWLESDEVYQALHKRAMVQVTEVLEDEATRRAVEGVTKGVYYQGDLCGKERVYSDGMMMFLLRGAAPEKYRERTEVSGKVDVNHKWAGTMEDLLATYRNLLAKPATE